MSIVQVLNITAKEVTIESKYGFGNRLYRIGENCILMNSIGVSDTLEQPVFTGDIVRVKDQLTLKESNGVVEEQGPQRFIRTSDELLTNWAHYTLEVRGNIYEHPQELQV